MKKNWLFNKTVIISGASGGIGFTLAKSLIEKFDCKIIGIERNEKKLLQAIETLGDKKQNFTYQIFDVSVKEKWLEFYDYLLKNNIQPDVLINNAGFMLPFKKFENITQEECDEIINTNFLSCVNSTKILLPLIKQSKTPAIVNVSSAAALCPMVGQTMYSATKFAVRGFTEALQQDYKKQIYVAGIYPGFTKTNILGRIDDSAKQNKWIDRLMTPVDKAVKKIVKGLKRKKKRMILGIDGHAMSGFSRLFPKLTPSAIRKVLKVTKMEIFKDIFED